MDPLGGGWQLYGQTKGFGGPGFGTVVQGLGFEEGLQSNVVDSGGLAGLRLPKVWCF